MSYFWYHLNKSILMDFRLDLLSYFQSYEYLDMGSTDHLGYVYAAMMGIGGMINMEEVRMTEERQQKIKMQLGKQKTVKATVNVFKMNMKPPLGILLGGLAMGGAYHVRWDLYLREA